jgi:hypothetical protein
MFRKILLIGALLAPIGSVALAEETVAPAASAPAKGAKSTTKRHTSKKVSKQGRKASRNARRPKAKSAAVSDAGQQ